MRSRHTFPPAGPTVLIESTYLFAELSKKVFSLAQPLPRGIEYRIALRNMTSYGKPCKLGRRMDGPWRDVALGMYGNNAPASEAVFSVKWDEVEIDPKVIAFLLVSKIYEWFGVEHEGIPYTERIDNKSLIAPEQIQALR